MLIKEILSNKIILQNNKTIEFADKWQAQRYATFAFLDNPIKFNEWKKEKLEYLVQVHSVGFGLCGVFAWDGYQIHPLDHDYYNENMKVIAYSYFNNKSGDRCLDILVGDDW